MLKGYLTFVHSTHEI